MDGLFRVLFLDRDGDHEELDSRLRETDLIFTAVGRKNLDNVLIELAPGLVERQRKVWLLFCENGRGLAERYSNRTGRHTVALDTVMSRMSGSPVKESESDTSRCGPGNRSGWR